MVYPDKTNVLKLLQGGTAVPLCKGVSSFVDPVVVFSKLRNYSHAFLLETPSNGIITQTNRYSFLGANPTSIFKAGRCDDEMINVLRKFIFKYPVHYDRDHPPFTGGLVGFLGYGALCGFESINLKAPRDLKIDDWYFGVFDTVIVYDAFLNKVSIISIIFPEGNFRSSYDRALEKIDFFEKVISSVSKSCYKEETLIPNTRSVNKISPVSNMTQEYFENIVKRAKRYIKSGDVYQVNLSQRFVAKKNNVDLVDLYRRIRLINPSPFGGFLDFDPVKIISSSPERLICLRGRVASTRPIAGTVPRGLDPKNDNILRRKLFLSPKQRAEHIMLVDLERNDLGRVCEYSSVNVDQFMTVEKYSHVTHIVSNITGNLCRGKDAFDLIKAVFPGGTITGVPKIRCIEIIDQLEPVARGLYTGSMGYIGFNGWMDMNIIIRTFVIKDDNIYIQVGAGIVADSSPEREYKETLYKATALFEALIK